ncbi:ankyrin repeat and SAM domain-containing protein 3-like isoform X1 [Haliotis rufescens]|uniref:ankyrin repeat and SAM domain-containing protein 3-like isoform X1 n=1 Tax=Haliotis rufescens TaxID=6454 RepID=UPI00201F17CE|nr:ankyrin repeat and SAM domain-containing protein 3-like isoform X1 [Haliotis rufescens]
MTSAEAYEAYEASDEASESELLDKSLSFWKGWGVVEKEVFTPVPHDIHTACSIGHYDYVRSLIIRGDVEIDKKNRGSWTPLMYACYIGHDNIVNLLIDSGCDVNVKNHKGQTPLMLAASCGNETVGRTLCRNGAELEEWDKKGWTALFHATYAGHQNFVLFLLEHGANMSAVEPSSGKTPFLEAAAEGHEIIVQYFLHNGVDVNARAFNGDMARSLALINGHMKIVSLIENHVMPISTLRSEPDLDGDLSSSDEAYQRPRHHPTLRNSKTKLRDPSITDGPKAIARLIDRGHPNSCVPKGYMTFPQAEGPQAEETKLSYRDVTSPINPEDYTLDSSGGRESCEYDDDSNAFSKTGAITIKSSSSSSGGLVAALGLHRESSSDSDELVMSGSHDRKLESRDRMTETQDRKSVSHDRASETRDMTSHDKKSVSHDRTIESHDRKSKSRDQIPGKKTKSHTSNHDRHEQNVPQSPHIESQMENVQISNSSDISSPSFTSRTLSQIGKESDSDSSYSPMTSPSMMRDYGSDKDSAIVQDSEFPQDPTPLALRPQCTSQDGRSNSIAYDYLPPLQPRDTPTGLRRPLAETACILPGDPQDLHTLLQQLGLQKYLATFEEQDVDLPVFLSLTDNDLKEIGIKLFGPRKKMTNAIARWHSRAPLASSNLEQCYADRLEGEMQELAIQLNQVYANVEKLKAQVQQEQQLRSVTESCLMEERGRVQHVTMDTRHKCAEIKDTVKRLKHFHSEIKERLSTYLSSADDQSNHGSHSRQADVMKQGFSFDDRQTRPANDVKALSLEILIRKTEHYVKDIQQCVSLILVNNEHLMDKAIKCNVDQGYG